MKTHLVTGGAGFIGSHLAESLLARGDRVVVLDDLSTGRDQNIAHLRHGEHADRFSFHIGSIADPILTSELVARCDVIFHLAAAVGVKLVADDPVRTIETNIHPTESLLRLAVQGKKTFYLASTSEVYGKNPKSEWTEEDDLHFGPTTRPRWAYGASKAIDEFLGLAYHAKFGLEVVVGRFFNVVGPRQVGSYGMVIPRFVERALAGEPLTVYDDGGQTRCFAHVADAVKAVIGLTENPQAAGNVFNIGSDFAISMRDLATMVIDRTGSSSTIDFIPYEEAYGKDFEDVRRRVPNLSRLESTLGWKPELPLETILDDVITEKRNELNGE